MFHRLPAALFCILAVAIAGPGATAFAQDREPPERISGKPNLNGIWQAMNTAHWNLEGHSAEPIEEFWQKMSAE